MAELAVIFNFAVVMGVLYKFALPKASAFVQLRSEAIRVSMDEAGQLFDEAQVLLKKWTESWTGSSKHAEQLHADAKQNLENFKQNTLQQARHQSERIKDEAKLLAQSEVKKAKRNLQKEIVAASLVKSRAYLQSSLDEKQKRELIEQSLERVSDGGA